MAPAKVRTALVLVRNTLFIHISSCPTSRTLVIASPSSTQRSSSRREVVRKLKTNDFRHISLFMVLEKAITDLTQTWGVAIWKHRDWLGGCRGGWNWVGGEGWNLVVSCFRHLLLEKCSCFIQFFGPQTFTFPWVICAVKGFKIGTRRLRICLPPLLLQ